MGIEHHCKSLFKVGVSSVGGKGISIQAYDNQGIIGDDRGEIGSESIRVEVDRFVFQIGKSDIFLLGSSAAGWGRLLPYTGREACTCRSALKLLFS